MVNRVIGPRGAYRLIQIRVAVLECERQDVFWRWYLGSTCRGAGNSPP
jgi:hypothetical protein